MNEDVFINEYSKIGLDSQRKLLSFIINNDFCDINNVHYDLRNSNECMEFMAIFFKTLGFEVKRLFLENDNNKYWFLAINNGLKWVYYEANLKDIKGEYCFDNYDDLITFAFFKIISSLENLREIGENNFSVFKQYKLREIDELKGFEFENNVIQSKKGNEILLWNDLNKYKNYISLVKKIENDKSTIFKNNRYFAFFGVGFAITLIVGIILIWILSMYYYGKF